MSWFKRLGSLLGGGGSGNGNALYFAVKCSRCGEVITVRADRRWDLMQEFDSTGNGVSGYTLHKEVLGQRCPQLIRLEVGFDGARREQWRQIEGGEFVAAEG
ncbi:MAG: hypothetical protein ACYC1C_18800 [Chloroflexota bacterium]